MDDSLVAVECRRCNHATSSIVSTAGIEDRYVPLRETHEHHAHANHPLHSVDPLRTTFVRLQQANYTSAHIDVIRTIVRPLMCFVAAALRRKAGGGNAGRARLATITTAHPSIPG